MNTLFQRVKYWLKMLLWVSNGYIGQPGALPGPQKLTVLITYF